eukprot:5528241-Amphidinium_carterae.1
MMQTQLRAMYIFVHELPRPLVFCQLTMELQFDARLSQVIAEGEDGDNVQEFSMRMSSPFEKVMRFHGACKIALWKSKNSTQEAAFLQ